MKKTLLPCLLALAPFLAIADAPSIWATLDAQAAQMLQAATARDTHALHELDHAINGEVAALKTPAAGSDLTAALDEIGKEAAAAHHDAHAAAWDKVAADQAALVKALQTAEGLTTRK